MASHRDYHIKFRIGYDEISMSVFCGYHSVQTYSIKRLMHGFDFFFFFFWLKICILYYPMIINKYQGQRNLKYPVSCIQMSDICVSGLQLYNFFYKYSPLSMSSTVGIVVRRVLVFDWLEYITGHYH